MSVTEDAMIHQPFLMDSEVLVRDVLAETGLRVLDFVRFEVGQSTWMAHSWYKRFFSRFDQQMFCLSNKFFKPAASLLFDIKSAVFVLIESRSILILNASLLPSSLVSPLGADQYVGRRT